MLLKIIARRLSEYCERVGIIPEEQSGFQPNRSTNDVMFVIRLLQELALKNRIRWYVCFIHPTKDYDSVDLTLLGTVHSGFDVPKTMIGPFVSSTMACELACGLTTQGGLGAARC